MKLFLDENNLVLSYVTFCENYDELEAIEYLGEVPEDFENNHIFYAYNNGELILQEELKNNREKEKEEIKEKAEIESWFKWYDTQTIQYGRAQRMGKSFNRKMNDLDNEADQKAKRLSELNKKYPEEEPVLDEFIDSFNDIFGL